MEGLKNISFLLGLVIQICFILTLEKCLIQNIGRN